MAWTKIVAYSNSSYSKSFFNLNATCFKKLFRRECSFKTFYKMKAVYLQNEEGNEKFSVNLSFSEFNLNKIMNFERRVSDTLGIFLQRLNSRVKEYCRKKKDKLKLGVDEESMTIQSFFVHDNKPLSDDVVFKDIFEKKFEGDLKLRILDTYYEVFINSPTITQIALPKELRVGTSVFPIKFEGKCVDPQKCSFNWFKSMKPQKKSIPWDKCGEGYMYLLKPEDLNFYIKLECVAKNESQVGPTYEVVSETPVLDFTGAKLIQKRQELTQNRTKPDELRLVTYNILADTYVNTKEAKTTLFTYCDRNILELSYRKDLLLIELYGYNADVICLQEVDRKVFKEIILPTFGNADFSCFYHEKEGAREGCVLLCDRKKFKVLESNQFIFTEELNRNPLLEDIRDKIKKNFRLSDRLSLISSMIQVVVLEQITTNTILIIGNTHFYFHPDADHIRLLQGISAVRILQSKLDEFSKMYPDKKVTVILCGDFNSTPEEGVYQFVTKGSVDSTHKNWRSKEHEEIENLSCSHLLKMDSAYGTPPFTNYTVLFKGCLDYIYYDMNHLEVTQTVPLPSEEDLSLQTAIPSEFFPSDHVALIADFKIKS